MNWLRVLVFGICAIPWGLMAQVQGERAPYFTVGGSLVPELSRAAATSHFYYNEIHAQERGWRLGLREINLLGGWHPSSSLHLQTRVQLGRRQGQQLDQLRLLQAQIYWTPRDEPWSLRAGQLMNPFGAFYERPLPEDRLLITNPLPYSYYLNVSDRVGFSPALREPQQLLIDSVRDWGRPLLYPDGYRLGVHGHWEIQPDTLTLDLAWIHAAPLTPESWSQPLHPTFVGRLRWQPHFHWQQGLSVSYGGFLQREGINRPLARLAPFKQWLVGTDWKLGYGYLELRGEWIAAWQRVPIFEAGCACFAGDGQQAAWLASWGGYLDLRVEVPGWVGGYFAYRGEGMWFGADPLRDDLPWDDAVMRHSLGIGYQPTRFLLLKSVVAWQGVQRRDWRLAQWRSSLVVFL